MTTNEEQYTTIAEALRSAAGDADKQAADITDQIERLTHTREVAERYAADARKAAAVLEDSAEDPEPLQWWILEEGFIAKGGKKYSGPYANGVGVYTARTKLEEVLGHNLLFIDSEPVGAPGSEATA